MFNFNVDVNVFTELVSRFLKTNVIWFSFMAYNVVTCFGASDCLFMSEWLLATCVKIFICTMYRNVYSIFEECVFVFAGMFVCGTVRMFVSSMCA